MPPAPATAPVSLRDRLKSIRADVTAARDERAAAVKERDRAREAFAAADLRDARVVESEEFLAAERAVEQLGKSEDRLADVEAAERGILAMLGDSDWTRRASGAGADEPDDAVRALTATPGMLLASILERRKGDVATLPEHLRYRLAAMQTPLTTGQVSSVSEGDAVIDLLSPASVAMASGITILPIDTTKARVPRFTDLPVANWIPELGAFPKNGPGIEMVESEPPKVGLVTEVSLEVFEDLRPLTLAMLQTQLLRAVALAYDRGILFGSGVGAEPRGVANTTGIGLVSGVPLTNLAAFAEAIADLIAVNAFPGTLVMNPIDLGRLLQATEFTGNAQSNVPLWKTTIERAADGNYALTLPYFGIPVRATPAAPQGTALMYDPANIIAVIRREADIAIDPYYSFADTGAVGLRTYLRADVVVGQPGGAVKITYTPPPVTA